MSVSEAGCLYPAMAAGSETGRVLGALLAALLLLRTGPTSRYRKTGGDDGRPILSLVSTYGASERVGRPYVYIMRSGIRSQVSTYGTWGSSGRPWAST